MAVLISVKKERAGKKITLAFIGAVELDAEGKAVIEDSKAEMLADYLYNSPSLGYYVESLPTQIELEGEESSSTKKEEVEEVTEEESQEAEEDSLLEQIKSADLDTLRSLATELDLPEEEWIEKTVRPLRKYLTSKLS